MKKANGTWVRSDFEDEDEVLYFFHPADGGGGQAYVAMNADGTVEFSGDRKVTIRKDGKVVIEGAADLVV
jgi:hypothetical protein